MKLQTAGIAAALALTASLPFARGLVSGQAFYFRDLSRQFFPLRRFIVEGLLQGELRYWNPLVHEGEPLSLPAVSYPLDLLQVFAPDEHGFSLFLAAHVPLAALTFLCLARGLGTSSIAAAGGGLVYALGGYCLSCLNLYVFLQAAAWAPLVVLGLLKAATGGPRHCALAALATAVAISTTAVEIVAQAVLFGIVLSASRRDPGRWVRLAGSLALGCGLAAPTLALMARLVGESARAGGFPMDVVLGWSIHPVTFIQVLISGLYGDPFRLTDRFWGGQFFPAFPYVVSLYVGAAALSVGVVGARFGPAGKRLLLLAALAVVVCLGSWARFDILVEALPFLRSFRYPTKAFFSAHLAAALLVALGFEALSRPSDWRPWRWLAVSSLAGGALLVSTVALPRLLPAWNRAFLAAFFPAPFAWSQRVEMAQFVERDAAAGGLLALAVGLLALVVLFRRMLPVVAVAAMAGVIGADLLRAGAGLNPMVAPSFFELSPEMARLASDLRVRGARLFSCDPELGEAYWRGREVLTGSAEVWAIATLTETLTPFHNMPPGIPTAYSRDLTSLVPLHRVLPAREAGCASFAAIADRLRRAGVSHVLSLAPLEHPSLHQDAVLTPRRVEPLALHLYSLTPSLPRAAVAAEARSVSSISQAEALAGATSFQDSGGVAVEGLAEGVSGARGRVVSFSETPSRLELRVESDRDTVVVIRSAFAAGWSAVVNGSPAPILRADGRHRAVPIPDGASAVTLVYRPPGLRQGLALTAGSGLVLLGLWRAGRPRREPVA